MRAVVLVVTLLAAQAWCCTFNPGQKWQKTTYAESHMIYFGPGEGGIVQSFEGVEPVNLADFFIFAQSSSNLTVTMVSGDNGCAIGEIIVYTLSFSPSCEAAVLYRTTGSDVCDPLAGEHRLVGCTVANENRCFLSEGNYFVEVDDDEGDVVELFVGPRSQVGDSTPLSVVEFVGRTNATVFMRWEADKYYVSTPSGPNAVFEATIAGLSKPGAGIETPQTTPSFCTSAYSYAYEFAGPNCNQVSFLLQEGSSCVDTISRLGETSARHVCLNPLAEYWSESYWIYWSVFSQLSETTPSTSSSGSSSTSKVTTSAAAATPRVASLALLLALLVALV